MNLILKHGWIITQPEIDWEKGYEFLDKELQKVAPDAKTGRRTVDKLVKVWLKDGTEIWTVIHVEIQGKADPGFAKRMYMYNYRLFDKHHKKIVSLAVLTDNRKNWKPDRYGYEVCGCRVQLQFPVVKLLDYLKDWDYLESSVNLFAVVVVTHLKGLETRANATAQPLILPASTTSLTTIEGTKTLSFRHTVSFNPAFVSLIRQSASINNFMWFIVVDE
jgi:hypothetical protein